MKSVTVKNLKNEIVFKVLEKLNGKYEITMLTNIPQHRIEIRDNKKRKVFFK